MALIATFAYGLSQKSGGIGAALPLLGVLVLGAQRLLPALQQGYAAWAQIAGSQASLADVLVLLDQPPAAGGTSAGPRAAFVSGHHSIR